MSGVGRISITLVILFLGTTLADDHFLLMVMAVLCVLSPEGKAP